MPSRSVPARSQSPPVFAVLVSATKRRPADFPAENDGKPLSSGSVPVRTSSPVPATSARPTPNVRAPRRIEQSGSSADLLQAPQKSSPDPAVHHSFSDIPNRTSPAAADISENEGRKTTIHTEEKQSLGPMLLIVHECSRRKVRNYQAVGSSPRSYYHSPLEPSCVARYNPQLFLTFENLIRSTREIHLANGGRPSRAGRQESL